MEIRCLEKSTLPGMPQALDTLVDAQAAQAVLGLCAGVLPVWVRQLEMSRTQSEAAVTQMMQAFAGLAPQLNLLQSPAGQGMADLVPACEHALAPALRNGNLPQDARAAIEQVLHMLRDACAGAPQSGESETVAAQAMSEQIDRMYQGFQYQDRISQMIALLEADMNRLKEAIGNPSASTPPLDAWLSRLESQYAMEEQRRSHADAHGSGPDDPKETTFF